jgi:calcineurin-like phosphoesterase family protein
MNYWITTDTHFGHKMLAEDGLRPCGYEEKIFTELYNSIKEGDVLIHLGDVSFDNNHEWSVKINCFDFFRKWLIRGNHDKNGIEWYLDKGWDFVGDSISMKYFGFNILFSHIPQPFHYNFDVNIHGHFHNTDFRKHEPQIAAILTDKHILLALEYNDYRPWNLKSIIKKYRRDKNAK